MSLWRSQDYRAAAQATNGDPTIINSATVIGRMVQEKASGAVPVFTLNHLSHLTGVDYRFLRDCVERRDADPYRVFRIRKRQVGLDGKIRYRIICVPDARLMKVQRWINSKILTFGKVHEASVAFGTGDNVLKAALPHCGCRWLIKLDIVNFFESISEQAVFHIFLGMGFQRLVAFELARMCTRRGKWSIARSSSSWSSRSNRYSVISSYHSERLGHLPQGAPTSPRLANLAMRSFDADLTNLAEKNGLIYTRYADDLTLSTRRQDFARQDAARITHEAYQLLKAHGLNPNYTKTAIMPPGARRLVLGLLVDGVQPRLTKSFRDMLRSHIYFLTNPKHGPSKHANDLGFESIYGLRNHINGLIAHARQVDAGFADELWRKFNGISWP